MNSSDHDNVDEPNVGNAICDWNDAVNDFNRQNDMCSDDDENKEFEKVVPIFSNFTKVIYDEIIDILKICSNKTSLADSFRTWLIKNCSDI